MANKISEMLIPLTVSIPDYFFCYKKEWTQTIANEILLYQCTKARTVKKKVEGGEGEYIECMQDELIQILHTHTERS